MKKYERPVVIVNSDFAEGVYADSGTVADNGRPGCDSIYMNGIWQAQDNSSWWNNGVETKRGYKQQFGCLGCPANRGGGASDNGAGGCALLVDQAYLDGATSYDVDNGNRKPSWERRGHGPDEIVSDWDCG